MTGYIVRRLLWVVVILWGVSLLTFLVAYAVPADPARLYAGPRASLGDNVHFDPRMFEEFWLPRLGDAPLNVTLLVDFDHLAKAWDDIGPERAWRLRRANRDYLVRGVRPTAGAFHPKTYFFANEREGLLLVGSGNLTLGGIEKGHEVFCRFESHNPDGLAALRGWYEWMVYLVKRLDDALVSSRWVDLCSKVSWLQGTTASPLFASNWDRPLLDQVVAAFPAPVDELHVMAPFFDPRTQALAELIAATEPRQVHIYIGKDVSADGTHLAAMLQDRDCTVKVHGFEPPEFVHAKLIGIVSGEQGRLLSGSANLSLAALSATVLEGKGNVEAGVLLDTTADRVRSMFAPAGLLVVDKALQDLTILQLRPSERSSRYRLALHSATQQPDDRVKVVFSRQGSAIDLYLSTGSDVWRLRDGRTTDPLSDDVGGRLAWLTDGQGNRLSNAVPIDEPDRLAQALHDRASHPVDRPREMDERDLNTSVGAMLQRLHNTCIFDIDETPALTKPRPIPEETDDPGFWDRLAQEELRLDPRVSTYCHRGFARPGDNNDVLDLLQCMRDRVPWHGAGVHLVRSDGTRRLPESGGERNPASPHLQLRLYNVLARWCQAVGDSRLRWIDPLAPVINYTVPEAAVEAHAKLSERLKCK